jgi:hypothetical protein
MMFVVTVLALLQAASSSSAAGDLPNDRWQAMSTQQLAVKLLPPRLRKRVTTHEFSPAAHVTFSSRPYPMPDGFCERDQYRVSLRAPSRMTWTADIRRGDCPADGMAGFAHVNPNPQLHVAQAKMAIRWLEAAIAAAGGGQPLSFDLDCVSDAQPNLCADGARPALAKLAVDNASIVDGAFTCRASETRFALRQDAAASGAGPMPEWHLQLARGAARPRLTMRWTLANLKD